MADSIDRSASVTGVLSGFIFTSNEPRKSPRPISPARSASSCANASSSSNAFSSIGSIVGSTTGPPRPGGPGESPRRTITDAPFRYAREPMQTPLEETDKHTVKLTVEIPPDEVDKDLDRAYRKIAQQVKIPGFRKGRVPKKVIDAQFGHEAVLWEFIEESVPTYYRDALREHDLAPITEPDIELGDVEEGKPLVVTAVVEVRPRLKLEESDYKGVKVERPKVEITEDDVGRYLDSLRKRFAELETVSRVAREGGYVVLDLHAAVHRGEI